MLARDLLLCLGLRHLETRSSWGRGQYDQQEWDTRNAPKIRSWRTMLRAFAADPKPGRDATRPLFLCSGTPRTQPAYTGPILQPSRLRRYRSERQQDL